MPSGAFSCRYRMQPPLESIINNSIAFAHANEKLFSSHVSLFVFRIPRAFCLTGSAQPFLVEFLFQERHTACSPLVSCPEISRTPRPTRSAFPLPSSFVNSSCPAATTTTISTPSAPTPLKLVTIAVAMGRRRPSWARPRFSAPFTVGSDARHPRRFR